MLLILSFIGEDGPAIAGSPTKSLAPDSHLVSNLLGGANGNPCGRPPTDSPTCVTQIEHAPSENGSKLGWKSSNWKIITLTSSGVPRSTAVSTSFRQAQMAAWLEDAAYPSSPGPVLNEDCSTPFPES